MNYLNQIKSNNMTQVVSTYYYKYVYNNLKM